MPSPCACLGGIVQYLRGAKRLVDRLRIEVNATLGEAFLNLSPPSEERIEVDATLSEGFLDLWPLRFAKRVRRIEVEATLSEAFLKLSPPRFGKSIEVEATLSEGFLDLWPLRFAKRVRRIEVDATLSEAFLKLSPPCFGKSTGRRPANWPHGFGRFHRAPRTGMTLLSAFPGGVVQNLLQAIINARSLS